uniref:EF-hand domain-containing protein n=1 Tax=Romanomermis culicivorax TaxID=13658 RepID=A0A915KHX0_ROMCU
SGKLNTTSKRRISSDAFDPKTINELKEIRESKNQSSDQNFQSFGIMDQNKDGVIDKNDLKELYADLGQIPNDSQIDQMLKEASQPLNFSNFLSLFGKKLMGKQRNHNKVRHFLEYKRKFVSLSVY